MTQVLWDNYSKGCGHFEWGVASFRNMPETTIVLEGKMDRLRLFTHGTLPKVTELICTLYNVLHVTTE